MFRSLFRPQQIFLFRLFTVNTVLKSLPFSAISNPEAKRKPEPPSSSSSSSSKSSDELELMAICRLTQGKSEKVIALFKSYGFSSADILTIFSKRPGLILLNPVKILRPKLVFLSENGISRDNLTRLICAEPLILKRSLDRHIVPCILLLKSFFPSRDGNGTISHLSVKQLTKALRGFSGATAVPNIKNPENIEKLLRMGLRNVLHDHDKMREAREMGLHTLSLKFIISIMDSGK